MNCLLVIKNGDAMETKNHLQLAQKIAHEKNLGKYGKYFVLGNIMPDINLFTYFRGHKYSDSIDYVRQKANELINEKSWDSHSYYNLGIILHYIADYFTYPHNHTFKGTLAEHCEYEKRLRTPFLTSLKTSYTQIKKERKLTLNVKQLFQHIELHHKEYIATTPSISKDCSYILYITEYVMDALKALHEQKQLSMVVMDV